MTGVAFAYSIGLCTLAVAVIGALLAARRLPWRVALAIAGAKAAIAGIYYAWFYDGTWGLLDDVWYFKQGAELLAGGYGPISIFYRKGGLITLFAMSGGRHILYGWVNLTAQFLVGSYYHAAVFLNVLLTFVVAEIAYRTAQRAGVTPAYAAGLYGFTLVQWDLVAWSTFVNVKDIVVLTLTVALMYAFFLLQTRVTARRIAGALAATFLLLWIRFYAPLIVLAAVGLQRLLFARRRVSRRQLALVALLAVGAAALMGRSLLVLAVTSLLPNLPQLPAGLVRAVLTPQPWSVSPENGFLVIPAFLHLVALPAAVWGAVRIWRMSDDGRIALIYAGLILTTLALFPDLQGPRQRVQLLFILAWAQWDGLCAFAALYSRHVRAPAHPRPV